MTDERASTDPPAPDPALALLEADSVPWGILAGDAMVKAAPLASVHTGTVQPGRYLVAVGGDTASVEVALEAGRAGAGADLVGSVFLPSIHADVVAAMTDSRLGADAAGDAVGVVETATVAPILDAADAGVKAARVDVVAIRLADGLGGKAYVVFSGDVAEVETAVEAAVARVGSEPGVDHVVIPALADEMRSDLLAGLEFNARLRARGAT